MALSEGGGSATVEAAIVALIDTSQAAGQIAIASSFAEIRTPSGSATYGVLPEGATNIFVIPIAAMKAIAGTLLTKENQ
ncbi:conserved hypothetical protein [Mesorhizobium ventifaucium]|uniref:Uncharacterized protein n=1 Tax=Mesorhizobium ventifaucium TaxID=666020 RepID=A0ABN8KGU0_9HYPH|nr:conserved hypothetical protein [Mesorhizobium ventifaucium]